MSHSCSTALLIENQRYDLYKWGQKWSLLFFRRYTLPESFILHTTAETKTNPEFNVYHNKISCSMLKEKNKKKRGKCHKMFCKVGNKFSFSQVVNKTSSLYLSLLSSSVFQKCLMKSKFCVATFSSIVTVSGSCNIFGVCRKGRRAQINHPACTNIRQQEWAMG